MGSRAGALAAIAIGGCFGLSLARALLDAWPWMAGPFPRAPLALLAALALAAAGHRLGRKTPLTYTLLPLLIPVPILFLPDVDPVRDWVLVLGGLGGVTVAILYSQFPNDRTPRPANGPIPHASTSPIFHFLYPVSLALLAALLYLRTLAPTVGEADTFEFQVNILRLGISHGSGYPLYILLARLFSLLPAGGTAAGRINLSSAFFGLTSALAAYALARTLGASRPASWIAALSLAVSIGLWSRAVEAEVYTLHVTMVGVLLLLAFQLRGGLEIRDWRLEGWSLFYLMCFVLGLSLANHLTTILLIPALLIAILTHLKSSSTSPEATPEGLRGPVSNPLISNSSASTLIPLIRHLLLATLCLLLGLSLYLYLPLRWPALNHGEVMTWDMFQHFITGREAQGALRLDAWYADPGRYLIVGRKVLDQFGWPGALTALVGLAALFRKRPAGAAITLAAYGTFAFLGLSFYVPDPDYSSFLLPSHLVQAVWIACGISFLGEALAQRTRHAIPGASRDYVLRVALYSLSFFLPAFLIWHNWPRVDQSNDWGEYRLGQYILSLPLAQNAAILADSELIAPLYYLQVAEGARPDLDIVVLPDEATYRAELDGRVSNGQTVYLGRYLPHLAEVYYLRSAGPLTEARLEPGALAGGVTPVEKNFGQVIRLHGFNLESGAAPADGALRVTFYWQAIQPPAGNYLVALRLVDLAGTPVLTAPPQVPVGQMYNTAAWPADDVIADFHALALDPALAPGAYQLQVGLFPPFSRDGLPVTPGGSWLTVSEVTLTSPTRAPSISNPARIRFGDDAWLLGFDAPGTAAPGTSTQVTLYWLSARGLEAQLCAAESCHAVHVRAGDQVTITRVTVPTPEAARDLALRVGAPGETAECAWWAPRTAADCALTYISLEGAALRPDAINFDNQIVLDSLSLETKETAPGSTVIVAAQWRGLRPMDVDYTVFVHLLGPDGIVHGQEDRWPVQGTQPTSQWPVNQPILDRFEVRVPDDAPRGMYTVEVGWYLLATLDRLPVVDAGGIAIDDKFVVRGLEVR